MSPDPTKDQERTELFKRAGQSQEEFRKLVTSMSVASLGVFFVTLTGERSASLSAVQSIGLMIAITMMSIATLSGIIAWTAAGADFHDKATYGPSCKGLAHDVKRTSDWCLLVFFIFGIFASAFYIAQSAQKPSTQTISLHFTPVSKPPFLLQLPNRNQQFSESDGAINAFRDEVKKQHGGPPP